MSNLWINIRFGAYHLQLTNDWKVEWMYNEYHSKEKRDQRFKWFAIYEFPGLNRFLR
jgi:hypothetical protein